MPRGNGPRPDALLSQWEAKLSRLDETLQRTEPGSLKRVRFGSMRSELQRCVDQLRQSLGGGEVLR